MFLSHVQSTIFHIQRVASCRISSREVGPSPSVRWPARMRTGGRSLLHLQMPCRCQRYLEKNDGKNDGKTMGNLVFMEKLWELRYGNILIWPRKR